MKELEDETQSSSALDAMLFWSSSHSSLFDFRSNLLFRAKLHLQLYRLTFTTVEQRPQVPIRNLSRTNQLETDETVTEPNRQIQYV